MDFPTVEGVAAARAFVEGPAFGASPAWQALGRGVLLGLGAALPIGPVNVEIARRVLRTGFWTGVALGFGAVTVDVVYAVVSTLSFVRLLEQPTFVLPVTAMGVLLLTYLGVQCLRSARAALRTDPLAAAAIEDRADGPAGPDEADGCGPEEDADGPAGRSSSAAYATGLLMTFLNPMTLAFWFTVVPAAGASLAAAPVSGSGAGRPGAVPATAGDLPMMCAGVFIGTVGWVVSFAGLLAGASRAARRDEGRRRRWLAAADAVGGVALLFFAALAAAEFWRRLSPLL